MSGLMPLPAERAAAFAWVDAAPTRAVIAALEARRAGAARFVGGCVRDSLVGRAVSDIDIATLLRPDETMAALNAAGLKSVPTGIDHGTVTAIADGKPFEITTVRADVETDGRRAVVAFAEGWDEDWRRRDFTMNAIYLTPDKQLYDPAAGAEDAAAGLVRFIGDADARIREDYLRILRFFRFSAWYGRNLDETGLNASARLKGGLRHLSAERVRVETLKLLAAPAALPVLEAMRDCGVLAEIWPHLENLTALSSLLEIEAVLKLAPRPLLRLATLTTDDGAALATRLRLSNAEREALAGARRAAGVATATAPRADMRAAAYRNGALAFRDGVLVAWAMSRAGVADKAWTEFYGEMAAWTPPPFPLKGADFIAAGHSAGVALGETLKAAEAWWIENDFLDEAALRARYGLPVST